MKHQLEEWVHQWSEMEQMPILALLSLGYLLELADAIGRNRVEETLSILKFLLPTAPSMMDNLIISSLFKMHLVSVTTANVGCQLPSYSEFFENLTESLKPSFEIKDQSLIYPNSLFYMGAH